MSKPAVAPGSNWASLKKTLPVDKDKGKDKGKGKSNTLPPSKKRKHGGLSGIGSMSKHLDSSDAGPSTRLVETRIEPVVDVKDKVVVFLDPPSSKPLLQELRQMVAGNAILNEAKKAPGNYIAIDCEMVGLGYMGSESALARVSLVNYHGHVLLDTFVQPRERVTDWRTWVSGVREKDIVGAPTFDEVQRQVAQLVEGRVLVGHAIENDMKALLLSHPNPLLRDTQKCKPLREAAKSKRPGLKKLAEIELGLMIQAGQHSSVTDARATMALYRLHKPEWEASLRHVMDAYREKAGLGPMPSKAAGSKAPGKRKRAGDEDDEDEGGDGDDDGESEDGKAKHRGKRPVAQFPGGGRKGISSGLSVVVRRYGKRVDGDQPRRRGPGDATPRSISASGAGSGGNWWEEAAR